MLEAIYERQFSRHCESIGVECLKLRIDGRDGFPDRTLLCPDGSVGFVEFKQPGKQLRPQQRLWKRLLESLGFAYAIAFSFEDAVAFLDTLLETDE